MKKGYWKQAYWDLYDKTYGSQAEIHGLKMTIETLEATVAQLERERDEGQRVIEALPDDVQRYGMEGLDW